MSKKTKKMLWLTVGVTAGVLLTSVAKKIKEDIDTIVDENRDFGEKSKEWFVEKKKIFKEMIDEKNQQIERITTKLKADIIKEIDEVQRKELVEKATRKIAQLRDEIKKISDQRREEFLYYMRKMNATKIADAAYNAGLNVKKTIKENFVSNTKPATDMDFDFDIEIETTDFQEEDE